LLELTASERGYTSNGWISYQAAQKYGGHVKRGERAATVVWWDKRPRRRGDPAALDTSAEEDGELKEYVWLIRTFPVFSLDQCAGLEQLREGITRDRIDFVPIDACSRIIAKNGAVVSHGSNAAFYSSLTDSITLPAPTSFSSVDAYYGTFFHELTHWSGHPRRLNRDFGKRFGDGRYAVEELVAELGAAFLSSTCGIEHVTQAASYIESWLRVLRQDSRAILTAARSASIAADYLTRSEGVDSSIELPA
jgi:antirestriction protein ArdC